MQVIGNSSSSVMNGPGSLNPSTPNNQHIGNADPLASPAFERTPTLVHSPAPTNALWYYKYANAECQGIEYVIPYVSRFIVVIAACYYGFVLLDTLGDSKGWKVSIIPALLIVSVPVVLYLLVYLYRRRYGVIFDEDESQRSRKKYYEADLGALSASYDLSRFIS
jgi:hypothetical protein